MVAGSGWRQDIPEALISEVGSELVAVRLKLVGDGLRGTPGSSGLSCCVSLY